MSAYLVMMSLSPTLSTLKSKKRKAARLAKTKEAALIGSANTRRFLVQRGWAPASSDFSRSSRKSNPQVDRVVLAFIDKKTAAGGFFGLTARPSRSVRPRPASEYAKLKNPGVQQFISGQAQRKVTKVSPPAGSAPAFLIHVPAWDHASEVLKALAYVTCIPVGQRVAFTLRLTPDVARRALLSRKGAAGYIQDRIAAELRAAVPGASPDFMMILETTGDGMGTLQALGLHVHGVLVRTASSLPVVKAALRRAAGKTQASKQARLLMTRSALHALGWMAYIYKHRLSTSQAIKNAQAQLRTRPTTDLVPVLGATARLRKQAQVWYTVQRETEDLTFLLRKKAMAPASK